MKLDLVGRRALVTGGSRGIGRAIAIALARQGVDVAFAYVRNRTAAEASVAAIEGEGVRALAVKASVADEAGQDRLLEEVSGAFPEVDFLISSAASGVLRPAMTLTRHHFDFTLATNAWAFLGLCQRFVPLMPDGGRVVAISSIGAVRSIANYAAVGASKGALESLVRHLAMELGERRVTVNAVSASAVETDALAHFPNRNEILGESLSRSFLGRAVTPEDVASAVLLLCSDLAAAITGQTLFVDGGFTVSG